jgi:hypothetical protein
MWYAKNPINTGIFPKATNVIAVTTVIWFYWFYAARLGFALN